MLPPGARGRVGECTKSDATGNDNFQIVVGDYSETAIDWNALGQTIRPADLPDELWNALLTRLQANVGDSWDDFARAISRAATLLPAGLGRHDALRDVVQLEFDRALSQLDASVEGRLYLSDAAHPLANVGIHLHDAQSGEHFSTVSLTDGTFLIPVIAPGTYAVSFDGFAPAAPIQLVVGADDIGNLAWVAAPAGEISGGVFLAPFGIPVRDAVVSAVSEAGDVAVASTDSAGRYRLGGLPPGTYLVKATKDNFAASAPRRASVGTGQKQSNVNIGLREAGTVRGLVTRDGSPVANATVSAENFTASGGGSTTTLSDGTYSITGLSAGSYDVTASAPGAVASRLANVAVAASSASQNVDFNLVAAGSVTGTVKLGDGSPRRSRCCRWKARPDCFPRKAMSGESLRSPMYLPALTP